MSTMTTETNPTDDVTAASAALRALAAADGGEVLAGQLSRLVAVIANEALRTKRFRTDLLAALVPEPVGDGTDAGAESAAADASSEPAVAGTEGRKAMTTAPVSPATRSQLVRMTKAQLKQLIDREGMDPDRTIKAKSTKDEMVDLVLAFRQTPGAERTTAAGSERTTPAEQPAPTPPAIAPKRRRQPSVLNPYEVAASEGALGLREQLQRLDVEQLKDVVAEYGMNHDRRAMNWTDPGRLVERILEKTDFGATQGKAFRIGSQKIGAVRRVSAEPAQT